LAQSAFTQQYDQGCGCYDNLSCVYEPSRAPLQHSPDKSCIGCILPLSHTVVPGCSFSLPLVNMPSTNTLLAVSAAVGCVLAQKVPAAAQIVDQRSFNVLEFVPPPVEANDSTV
jgi:hypothetical protein